MNFGKIKKIYGGLKMSWPAVILFAIVAGIYTGTVMLFSLLEDTSFQDIGIYYEWWVIFAVIVVVNCKRNWEAMLKCFVFFLISQPLIYAVEIIFGHVSFDLAFLYYRSIWLPMTFTVLPGGFIAYYCKNQSVCGAIILGFGNTIQFLMGVMYTIKCVRNFPYHILSLITCVASILVMSFAIQESKKNRLIALLVPVGITVAAFVYSLFGGNFCFG